MGELEHRDDQTTSDTKSKEADGGTTDEPSEDEIVAKELDSSASGKERGSTKSNDASTKDNAPRIGFKHDPAEEALMAAVEPEFDAPKKKKNKKKRPKSQRGLVRP